MNSIHDAERLADIIGAELPYLRRYARALTGSQGTGDTYAAATLEAVLQDRDGFATDGVAPRVALFRAFHAIWESSGAPVETGETPLEARAQKHLARLTPGTRETLLLNSIEGFSVQQIATIMGTDMAEAESRLDLAYREMADSVRGRILIIEDEAIIAMDLENIVSDLGHGVTGLAHTAARAVELGQADRPDLILADIHLADNSSGIDAVNTLLAEFGDVPVIFVTAYPERLLTGERPEPAFLITKPFSDAQVRTAVSQAMFFRSTETLKT
jgi:CheY-like chemotaxis protein/DNA-directed RNA polymerase specialized sigma24 family protein